MATKKRWLMVLGMALVLFSLSNCHINDATPQFISMLSCGLVACPQIQLTLTSLDYPGHIYKIDVTGTYQTVVMDSGTYVWNLPTNPCTIVTTGTLTMPAGTSYWWITCDQGLVRAF